MRVLNVGCGKAKHDFPEVGVATEVVGIDISPQSQADLLHDLDRLPWPLESDRFDLIIMQDIIEHLDDVPGVLNEIWRIGADRCRVRIRTPHFSSWYAYNDPTHRRFFGAYVFDGFLVSSVNDLYAEGTYRMIRREILFPKVWRITGVAWMANRFTHRWEQLFAFLFRAENLAFELEVVKQGRAATESTAQHT